CERAPSHRRIKPQSERWRSLWTAAVAGALGRGRVTEGALVPGHQRADQRSEGVLEHPALAAIELAAGLLGDREHPQGRLDLQLEGVDDPAHLEVAIVGHGQPQVLVLAVVALRRAEVHAGRLVL